jgi:hypothetical protein
MRSLHFVRFLKHVPRIGVEKESHAIFARECQGNKCDCLVDPLIGLCAAKPQKSLTRSAEAFTPQAGDPKIVVGSLEQVKRQSVRRDS